MDHTATRGRRDATALTIGSLVNGLLAYVFFALVTRTLGAGPSAPVAVLWAWWSFAGAALTFPVQHWITRTAALAEGEAAVRRGLARVAAAVSLASVVAGALAWLFRERLFGPEQGADVFPLLVVAVGVGSGLLGVLRGLLAGRHRFTALAMALAGENALRCVAAAVLATIGVRDPAAYGLALIAGFVVVVCWPSALVPRLAGTGGPGTPLAFVTGASAGQLLAQVTLTGGPVLLAAVGGAPAEVTALFAGLALFRAPYTLALGVVSALTGRLTRLVDQGRHRDLVRVREAVVAGTVVLGVAGGLGAAWLGPPVLELVFGEDVRLARGATAVVAVGSVVALANLVLTVGLLARGRPALAAASWLTALPAGVLAFLIGPDGELTRTCWTFLVVEVVAWLVFLGLEWRSDSSRRVGHQEH